MKPSRVRFTITLAGLVLAAAGAACATSSGPALDTSRDGAADVTHASDARGLGKGDGSARDASHDAGVQAPQGCDVSCTAAGGKCVNNGCVLLENPGGVSAGDQQKLQVGGGADAGFKWLYPYDGTVFPRGLISPTLQFGGTAPDSVLVHITYSSMEFYGYYGASNPGRVQLSPATWQAIMQGALANDTVKVEVTKISAGAVSGPITESWTVAQGNMRGRIYYETYGSALLPGGVLSSVGIMTIAPGAAAPTPVASGCGNVCHTASANGSTLVSATGFAGISSISYNLKTSPVSTIYSNPQQTFAYGGIYPDGTFAMSATHYRTWIGGPSRLYDTTTGANIPAAGWDSVITNAGTSAFTPDGTMMVFNYEDKYSDGSGHTLGIANFAVGTKTFSGISALVTDMTRTLAWPAFTPDDKSVVYHAGSSTDFETDGVSDAGVATTGDLYRVDVATKTTVRLNALDGYTTGGGTYLPAADPDLSFAPTVLPEAVGGYFWVVFTSHRSYGNTLPSKDNGDQNGKLWVAAIDLSPTAGQDSSHPAFYLDGQESVSDNLRGFWVLSPCQQQGTSCSAGDECCEGFCRPLTDGGAYSCVAPPAGACANEYEKCTSTSGCCQASSGYQCIGGFCSAPPPK